MTPTQISRVRPTDTRVERDKVVSGKLRSSVGSGWCQDKEHEGTNDWWDAKKSEGWSLALRPCGKPGSAHRGNDLNGTEWNVKEDRGVFIEPEGSDDQWTCDEISKVLGFCKSYSPNVVMPPLGTEMAKIMQNQPQVLKSNKLSTTWSHLNSLDSTPIWFSRSRSIARTLS